jgi:lysine 2,3-aminomutase
LFRGSAISLFGSLDVALRKGWQRFSINGLHPEGPTTIQKEVTMLQSHSNQARETIFKSANAGPHAAPVESQPAVPSVEALPDGNRCISLDELRILLLLSANEMRPIEQANRLFHVKIPQYYAELMTEHVVLRQVVVPSSKELIVYSDDADTDVHADESRYQPVEGIVHRYPGKLLFLPTLQCFGHCRFCFRSGHRVKALSREKIDMAIDYIRNRTDIREVLVTGGDPLVLPLPVLEEILARVHAIRHVEIIRIGTRALSYAPGVITPELVAMLARYKPVFMTLSFVHPAEVTPYCEEKLNLLADSGIVMLQQGPILKGINDDAVVLKRMYEKLARNRVLAYYAIYGIFAPGVRHFIVNRDEARRLLEKLENNTSGHCLPHMITLDQGENKTRSVT